MQAKVYKVIKSIKWKRVIYFINFLLFTFTYSAQAQKDSTSYAGQFSLGMRNTISAFTDAQSIGMGSGGEFRIRLGKHLNTEWFADYISTDIQGLGYRRDAHIGWSVVFYLSKNPLTIGKITTYILAGHCFDFTEVYSAYPGILPQERWSSAVQGGFGMHYNLTKHFDISLLSQYMEHLGSDIDSQIESNGQQQYLNIQKKTGLSFEGHLLTTLSLNYEIGNLWGRK